MRKCSFCGGPAEALKIEAEMVETDGLDEIRKVELLICLACADSEYDGTEKFPGVRAL